MFVRWFFTLTFLVDQLEISVAVLGLDCAGRTAGTRGGGGLSLGENGIQRAQRPANGRGQ